MPNKYGWTKEDEDRYIEGVYYKVNHVLYLKKAGNMWVVRLRNTWTGEDEALRFYFAKKRAQAFMQEYMKGHPIR